MDCNIDEITDSSILDDMYEELKRLQLRIPQKLNEIKSSPHYNHKNLNDLVRCLNNAHQIDIIHRSSQRFEEDKLYMVNYDSINDRKKPNVLGQFTVLGTFDHKKGRRSQYDIKLYACPASKAHAPGAYKSNTEKGSFYCSCPDHKFNSAKKNTVCKHITFIVCQVAKVMTRHFFETKYLTQQQTEDLIKKVSKDSDIWKDKCLCREVKTLSLQSFKESKREIDDEDVCPICYDTLGRDDLLSCPRCSNYVHNECMMVWMEKQKRCVYCADTLWEHYEVVKNGQSIVRLS